MVVSFLKYFIWTDKTNTIQWLVNRQYPTLVCMKPRRAHYWWSKIGSRSGYSLGCVFCSCWTSSWSTILQNTCRYLCHVKQGFTVPKVHRERKNVCSQVHLEAWVVVSHSEASIPSQAGCERVGISSWTRDERTTRRKSRWCQWQLEVTSATKSTSPILDSHPKVKPWLTPKEFGLKSGERD